MPSASTPTSFLKKHPIICTFGCLLLLGGAFGTYKHYVGGTTTTRYVIASATKGTLITSVTGSGQVSASDQIDIKSKASGDIVTISVVDGQEVKTGGIILQLDARDAYKNVRDAEASLKNAQLALQKLLQPTDTLTLIQSQNALAAAQDTNQKAESDLAKAYEDGYNNMTNAFLDLPGVMQGLQSVIYGTEVGTAGQDNISAYSDLLKGADYAIINYHDDAIQKYTIARTAYDTSFNNYKTLSRTSNTSTIEKALLESYETTKKISDAVKSTNNFLDFFQDSATTHIIKLPTQLSGHQSNIDTFTSKTNTQIAALLGTLTTIKNSKDAIVSSKRTIAEREASLTKTTNGVDELELATQKLTVEQRQNALTDARTALSNYTTRAPFDGVITKVTVKKYDTVGSGTSIATLITKQKIATITLNEVDAAKVKLGQKVTLTFDAIDELSISGKVVEIDSTGTVSQGVVSYTVKISFDTQDDRIKPGMSVSATIMTDVKTDVVMIPNNAVKSSGNTIYIEQLAGKQSEDTRGIESSTAPVRKEIAIGLANDTYTEIVSGLAEGDQFITKTITTQTKTTSAAPSLFGGQNTRGTTGGSAVRMLR